MITAEGRIPPHSEEAEQSVLGSILIDKDALVTVASFLRAEHFYNDKNQKIYETILQLYEEGQPIDLVTLSEKLKQRRLYKKVEAVSYLTELANLLPTSAHIESYARIICDYAARRSLITAAAKLTENCFNEEIEAGEVLDKAEQDIFAISQEAVRRDFISLKDALAESFDRLDKLQQKGAGGLRGVATGFADLDNKLAGMQESNLLILAARPGIGKTAFVLNVAQYVAVKEGMPVGFFSLEMSKEELVDRMLVAQADIDAWRLKTGRLSEDDFDRLQEAMGVLADAGFYIDDTPGISVLEMRTKARRLQAKHGLSLLIVDYLQLADAGRSFDSRVTEVSMISQALKNLAREIRIPVLAVSQLSRAVEARGTKIPQLADLRESGAIEQDADVVMFLYRPEEEKISEEMLIKLLIAKHRNGPLGEIDLFFRGDRIKFYSAEKRRTK